MNTKLEYSKGRLAASSQIYSSVMAYIKRCHLVRDEDISFLLLSSHRRYRESKVEKIFFKDEKKKKRERYEILHQLKSRLYYFTAFYLS